MAREVYRRRYAGIGALARDPNLALLGRFVNAERSAIHGELLSYLFLAREFVDELIALGRRDGERWLDARHDAGLWQVGQAAGGHGAVGVWSGIPPLDEDFAGCGDRAQVLCHARNAQQALDLLGSARHRELLTALGGALAQGEDQPQAGRVHELELLEVEHDRRLRVEVGGLDRALQMRRVGHVEFTVETENHPIRLQANLDSKLVPNPHSRMLAGRHRYYHRFRLLAPGPERGRIAYAGGAVTTLKIGGLDPAGSGHIDVAQRRPAGGGYCPREPPPMWAPVRGMPAGPNLGPPACRDFYVRPGAGATPQSRSRSAQAPTATLPAVAEAPPRSRRVRRPDRW